MTVIEFTYFARLRFNTPIYRSSKSKQVGKIVIKMTENEFQNVLL